MIPGGEGCKFKLKAKAGSKVQMDLGLAMKTCPNSDMPFISIVLQGGVSVCRCRFRLLFQSSQMALDSKNHFVVCTSMQFAGRTLM